MAIAGSLLKNVFSVLGYNIHKKNIELYNDNSMKSGMYRMKSYNIFPETIVDVGAAVGGWTRTAMEVWPAARYELLEPLLEQQGILAKLKSENPNVNFYQAVAGKATGEIAFDVSSDLHGSGIYGQDCENTRMVPMVTIDEIVKDKPGPVMIKLDTHGYELPILQGAKQTLKKTSLLVIEVYGFHVSPTCLLFHELSSYLYEKGFRLVDMVDIMRRPTDCAFWQADAFYIRKDHEVFTNNNFRKALLFQ